MPTLPHPLPAGIPSEEQFVADYCAARSVPTPEPSTQVRDRILCLKVDERTSIMPEVHS